MMRMIFALLIYSQVCFSNETYPMPTEPSHPGSQTALTEFSRTEERFLGRTSVVYLPKVSRTKKVPLVVFGHGQAIDETGYDETFKHLAGREVAVLYPKYDKGFFDRDWRRMASDYNKITSHILKKYDAIIDASKVVYSGHSKGAYIGLMAAGAPDRTAVSSLVLFAPAGFDPEYIKNMEAQVVTLVWGEKDSVIKKSDIETIYSELETNKQLLETVSYPEQEADHYFPQNKAFIFGGKNGISPFHYHGVWKWLISAAWDIQGGHRLNQPYLYGAHATETGDPQIFHKLKRNW